ncbi:hypothetical protein [Nocardia sp. BMG51109]|uniref:hypothetical protein n=1 Tax=Nocardia sp. BMG51109 TaxID=1056816 RepID=UPI00046327D1|nr:hypothetical protein [Nocardia sp. BMG51109]
MSSSVLSFTAEADRTTSADLLAKYRSYRETYQRLYGPVRYDRCSRALTIRAHDVRAFMTPPLFGAGALEVLGAGRLPVYTVFGTESSVWVFVTGYPGPDDNPLELSLGILRHRLPVVTVGAGAELALPTPGYTRRAWLRGLPDGQLPAYGEVVRALVGAAS